MHCSLYVDKAGNDMMIASMMMDDEKHESEGYPHNVREQRQGRHDGWHHHIQRRLYHRHVGWLEGIESIRDVPSQIEGVWLTMLLP